MSPFIPLTLLFVLASAAEECFLVKPFIGKLNVTPRGATDFYGDAYNAGDVVSLTCKEGMRWWKHATNKAPVHKYKCLADGGWESLETGIISPKAETPQIQSAIFENCVHCEVPSYITSENWCQGNRCTLAVSCSNPNDVVKNTNVSARNYTCDITKNKWVDEVTKLPVEDEDITCTCKPKKQP